MSSTTEYEKLISVLDAIDIHHEFKDEWRNDEVKLRIFIKIHIGNFLPSETDTFGTYLSRLRDFKGMSNVELAKRTGLTEQTISKYLHDAGRTKESTLALMIAFELKPPQIDAVFSLAELRIDRKTNYNDIINYYLENSNSESVKECNKTLILFGFLPLTTIGTDASNR